MKFKISGSATPEKLRRKVKAAKDFRKPYTRAAKVIKKGVRAGLNSQGASLGKRFVPITRDWALRKRRKGLSPRTMTATGTLAASVERLQAHVRPTKLAIIYRGEKAVTHYGTRHMPGREWFIISPKAAKATLNYLTNHVSRHLR